MATPGLPLGEAPPSLSPTPARSWWPGYLIATIVLLAVIVLGAAVGGPLGEFVVAGAQTIPFAILAVLAYLGVRYDWVKILSYLWLALVLGGLAFIAVIFIVAAQLGGLMLDPATPADPNAVVAGVFAPAVGWAVVWSVLGLVVSVVLALPPTRRAVARILPIDPSSSVHATALSLIGGSIIICFGQLIAVGGVPPLLTLVNAMPDEATGGMQSGGLLSTIYAFAWTVPGAMIAGGWPMVRSFRAMLQRVGFVAPTWRQVVAGIVIALVLVGAMSLLNPALEAMWTALGWPTTDSAAFDQLLGSLISPIGAVVIGVTAGIGEELVVRGVLQPRLGILLSNLFFTGLHAFQYGFDALLTVFVIGIVLGFVRKRTNTTTAAIVHGVYNFTLVMISALTASS